MARGTRRYKRIRRSSSTRRSRSRRSMVRKRPSRVAPRGRGYLRVGGAYRSQKQLRVEKKANSYSTLMPYAGGTNTLITLTGIPTTSGNASTAPADTTTSYRWAMQPFAGIGQDSTASGRIGRQIQVKAIHFTGAVRWAALAVAGTDGQPDGGGGAVASNPAWAGNVHLITVLDKQANGSIPAATDIWQIPVSATNSTNPTGVNLLQAGAYSECMVRNLDNATRFRILDHTIVRRPSNYNVVGPYSVPGFFLMTTPGVASFDINIPCNMVVEYSGADGWTANIKSNNVFLFAWVETPLGMNPAGDHAFLTLTKRVRYYDV